MNDWNVVVTVHEGEYNRARKLLERIEPVGRTDFFNVLVMRVADIPQFLEELRAMQGTDPAELSCLARVMPVTEAFGFHSAGELDEKARHAASAWLPALAGKRFHVRMHRRGFKGRLSSLEEEQGLDHYLLDALELAGTPGHIDFTDPDVILALETVGTRGGISCWRREELMRYTFLRLD